MKPKTITVRLERKEPGDRQYQMRTSEATITADLDEGENPVHAASRLQTMLRQALYPDIEHQKLMQDIEEERLALRGGQPPERMLVEPAPTALLSQQVPPRPSREQPAGLDYSDTCCSSCTDPLRNLTKAELEHSVAREGVPLCRDCMYVRQRKREKDAKDAEKAAKKAAKKEAPTA